MMDRKKVQFDKEAGREPETNGSEKRFEAGLNNEVKLREKMTCPECGHVFKGNGWDGIDAHWRSKHEGVMPYEDAWPLLKSGKYSSN